MTNEHDHPVGDANPSDHAADADSIPAPHFDGENTNTADDLINDQTADVSRRGGIDAAGGAV